MAFFVYYRSKKYQSAYQHRARNSFQALFTGLPHPGKVLEVLDFFCCPGKFESP